LTGKRTIVAYATKGGVTEESASVIANVLRDKYGLEVDVIDLKKNSTPNLSHYENVVIGSGVRMQRVYKEALRFIEKNDFEDKKVAIFLSSIEPRDEAIAKYISRTLEKYPKIKPIAAEAFGGRMKILGYTTSDKRDIKKVRSWAEELGKKISE
jgi:menaquinone-dependent protoporphyrinogen oxidase